MSRRGARGKPAWPHNLSLPPCRQPATSIEPKSSLSILTPLTQKGFHVGESSRGSDLSVLCYDDPSRGRFRCPAKPLLSLPSSPASPARGARTRRRISTPSSSGYGARSSTRFPGIGWIEPASSSSAAWLRRLRSQSGKRLGYACCGPRSRMVERRPPPLPPSTVCRPRTLLTCSLSSVLHPAHNYDHGRAARK